MVKSIRQIIREELNKVFEAFPTAHFNERVIDRLKGDYTNFTNESPHLQKIVFDSIEFLKKVNFPGQDNIGILLLKGPNKYIYHHVDNRGNVEHSEGRFIWAIIRANDIETLMLRNINDVPKNTQIRLTIDKLKNYVVNDKHLDYNLTEKDLRKLQLNLKIEPISNKPKENIVVINGVKWVVDDVEEEIYKKNNQNIKYNIYDFVETADEKLQDEILSFLIK
jgi:uncharacterized protein YlzI (FlbEa/FlbD family)